MVAAEKCVEEPFTSVRHGPVPMVMGLGVDSCPPESVRSTVARNNPNFFLARRNANTTSRNP